MSVGASFYKASTTTLCGSAMVPIHRVRVTSALGETLWSFEKSRRLWRQCSWRTRRPGSQMLNEVAAAQRDANVTAERERSASEDVTF